MGLKGGTIKKRRSDIPVRHTPLGAQWNARGPVSPPHTHKSSCLGIVRHVRRDLWLFNTNSYNFSNPSAFSAFLSKVSTPVQPDAKAISRMR